ncbi:MAG TPA: peptidase C15 [Chroococcidiopsis sp.]
MTFNSVLLTSFTTWEAHQRSNSSDDVVAEIERNPTKPGLHFLRQLPVDFHQAPAWAITHVTQLQPQAIALCGMAEGRSKLSLESRAVVNGEILHTTVDLNGLLPALTISEISHDAGQYVCNALYYAMLKHLRDRRSEVPCLFIHIPVLTHQNRAAILADFQQIIAQLV